MIPVTQETKTALHQAVKQVRAQITWATSATETQTLTSEDRIISLKKEAEGYYCKSTLRKITVVLAGTDINLLDKKITVTVQVKTGANTWGDITWGSFTITEAAVNEEKGTSTFTGYGGIAELQKTEYSVGELTFPTTVGGLTRQIADKFAMEIDEDLAITPAEYQRVEYIENTTNAVISMPFSLTGADTVTMDIDITGANSGWATLWCCRIDGTNSTNTSFANVVDGTSVRTDYGTNQKTVTIENTLGRHLFVANKGNFYIDGTQKASRSELEFTGGSVTTLMASQRDGSSNDNYGYGKIYSFKVERGGKVIHNLVPCYRRSDSLAGLCDVVDGTFYSPSGTGTFSAGSDYHTLPNIDAPISEDLWAKISGTTYRDILEEVAGATGTIAVIGRGDDRLNLNLPPISEASETLTESNLITAKIGEKWGRASAVVLSRQPQNDNIEVVDAETADSQAGYNWIQYSDTFRNGSKADGITTTVQEDGTLKVECTAQNGNWHTAWWDSQNQATGGSWSRWLANIQAGEQFTISFTIKKLPGATGMPTIYINNATGMSYQTLQGTIGTEYSEVYHTRNWNGEALSLHLGWHNCTGTFIIKNWQLKKGAYAPYEPYKTNGRVDLVIANNEILDPQRETTATPILDAVKGWQYRNSELKTEGHGYHEIGDRLDVSVAGETYTTVVTKSTIIVDGGIKETLISATPEVIPIDYAKTGGITKTVFRTELTVDKQAQQIDSIVSRQDATDASVAEQFTQVTQSLTNIVANVQATGGGNLIRNSVGFGKNSDGTLTIWQYGTGASTTTVKSQSAPSTLSAGAVSGHEIIMTGASTISQGVTLTPGETYTLALRAKKNTTGAITITVSNTSNSATITLASGTAYNWERQSVEFTPTVSANTVTITVPSGASLEITDLTLATGGAMTWRQASSEIYNTQVSLDQAGVQVRSSVYSGDYVEITPLEFSGWSAASGTMKKVFTLNRETTEVEQLEARSQLKMAPIKIVPLNNSSYKGWALVKEA